MDPATFNIADQIVTKLNDLTAEERSKVFAVLELMFCTSCGRFNSATEISKTFVSNSCIHYAERGLPHGFLARQTYLDERKKDVKTTAHLIRTRFL